MFSVASITSGIVQFLVDYFFFNSNLKFSKTLATRALENWMYRNQQADESFKNSIEEYTKRPSTSPYHPLVLQVVFLLISVIMILLELNISAT